MKKLEEQLGTLKKERELKEGALHALSGHIEILKKEAHQEATTTRDEASKKVMVAERAAETAIAAERAKHASHLRWACSGGTVLGAGAAVAWYKIFGKK